MGGSIVVSYRRIARVSQAKGLLGQVAVEPSADLPFHAAKGETLWVVPPDHDLIRETSVLSCDERGDRCVLTLQGVADRTTAQRLVGRYLLARDDGDKEGRGADEFGREGANNFPVGLDVCDEKAGRLGSIVARREGAAQTLWIVEGPYGEVLIPVVDGFIRARDARTVYVCLPDGLLELNR